MIKEYYNILETYLMGTFGDNFILLTIIFTTAMSIVYFIMISYLIIQLDTRYFVGKKVADKKNYGDNVSAPLHLALMNSSVTFVVNMAKIIIGVLLLLCGIAMLILPGQGLLTMLIGLSFIPFPGKKKLEQNILARKSVRFSLNWIRTKAKKEPFIFD